VSTARSAAQLFQWLLFVNGADVEPRDPGWLDYTEPKNVFTNGGTYG
jgi:hypothetical protein